ncbi:LysR substrate-binding domain-containing protein [Nioella aestuarii]|uniref:LysR substrate-binding domain-containing protein n=1 Tax=Nioella aestuarii TaxID=1662864 RepID=UPI003D7F8DC1
MSPRVSLRAMAAFAATVEDGSIAAAARRLNIAASAVAAAVDQVEAEVGASLLVRTRAKGIAPTGEGRVLAARFRTLLEDCDNVLEDARAGAATLSGHLRIGYYAPVAPAFLPALLIPLQQANPGLEITLVDCSADEAQEALLAGRLDLILFAAAPVRAGIVARKMLDLPPYVLAPLGHPITRDGATLEDVAAHPVILLDRPVAEPYVSALFRDRGLAPRIVARANTTEMVRSLVGAGAGLAVLNMRPRTDRSYGGEGLASVPLSGELPPITLLVGRADGRPKRAVAVVQDLLLGWASGPKARDLIVSQKG